MLYPKSFVDNFLTLHNLDHLRIQASIIKIWRSKVDTCVIGTKCNDTKGYLLLSSPLWAFDSNKSMKTLLVLYHFQGALIFRQFFIIPLISLTNTAPCSLIFQRRCWWTGAYSSNPPCPVRSHDCHITCGPQNATNRPQAN